jgi:hypothetical protein
MTHKSHIFVYIPHVRTLYAIRKVSDNPLRQDICFKLISSRKRKKNMYSYGNATLMKENQPWRVRLRRYGGAYADMEDSKYLRAKM